jgi:sugar phosphate isomerase/epimerase
MKRKRRVRIGNQSAFSAATPTQPFEYAVESGFDAFEWFPDKNEWGVGWEERDLGTEVRLKIKRTSVRHDIRLSVHAPWWLNPVSRHSQGRLFESIEFARDIGASLFNIHLYPDEGIDVYEKAITPLIRHVAKLSIALSIENTPLTGPGAFNALFARLGGLKRSRATIGMCLDLGHANLCESTRNDYLRFIDQLDPHLPIIHVHAHENYGDTDSHLALFTGPSGKNTVGIKGFVERMKRRGFSGSIILEQWPQPPSLLNRARDRLSPMFEVPPVTVRLAGKSEAVMAEPT